MIYLLFCLFVLFFSTGCPDEGYYSFYVSNESEQDIAVYAGLGGGGTLYPDTILPSQDWTRLIKKKSIVSEALNLTDIETFYYFILSQDTIDKYPWDTIRNKYMILKRYRLDRDKIKRMNWTITYP